MVSLATTPIPTAHSDADHVAHCHPIAIPNANAYKTRGDIRAVGRR